MSPKKTAYENPLIPNARLKHMYRAILRAHLLGQALPPAQRGLTATREAALVSSALDLTARDFVLDAFSSPVLDFIRDGKVRSSFWTVKQVQNLRIPPSLKSAHRLPAISNPAARIHAALGAAAALKSSAFLTRKDAEQSENAHDSAVVLSISISGEVPADIWKPALAHATQHDLPVIFLVLPSPKPRRATVANLRAIAHRAEVPAIPVDAADPVALYRVAQESIGHARIGGGPALIECITFPAPASRTPAAIAHIEDYILSRGIATRAWMDREASAFAAQIRSSKIASK